MLKRWLGNLWALLAWLLVCGLALVVIMVGAELFGKFAVVTLGATMWSIRFIVQVFYVIFGLLWLGFFMLMEHLLMGEEARAGLLLPRTLYAVGIELLVIGLMQLATLAYLPLSSVGIVLALIEVLAGAGLIWFARRKSWQAKLSKG